MNFNNGDKSIFPTASGSSDALTKREHYAGLAMQGLLASGKFQVDGEMCREAWSAADQMLWQQEQDEKND